MLQDTTYDATIENDGNEIIVEVYAYADGNKTIVFVQGACYDEYPDNETFADFYDSFTNNLIETMRDEKLSEKAISAVFAII